MQIHLSEPLTHEGEAKVYSAELGFSTFESKMGKYPIVFCEPLELTITHVGNKHLQIETRVCLAMEIPCDRCLEPVRVDFDFLLEKEVDMNALEEDRLRELDEQPYINGYHLDVDVLVRNELFVHMPMKVLCDENCKGICNRCGANLNHESCGCDVTELDPRMAVIRDIFKNANH